MQGHEGRESNRTRFLCILCPASCPKHIEKYRETAKVYTLEGLLYHVGVEHEFVRWRPRARSYPVPYKIYNNGNYFVKNFEESSNANMMNNFTQTEKKVPCWCNKTQPLSEIRCFFKLDISELAVSTKKLQQTASITGFFKPSKSAEKELQQVKG